jgi:phosphohistidine phosphatase
VARTLVLIRHAKAADGPVDVDRSLAPRGVRDARAIGAWLSDAGIAPDRVIVPPARRARQTWEGAAAQLPVSPAPMIDDRIYDNHVDALLEIVHEQAAEVATLVLVGHNPSFGELAYGLDDGSGDTEARQDLVAGFPTSAVAVFEVPGGWTELDPGHGVLTGFAAPRG